MKKYYVVVQDSRYLTGQKQVVVPDYCVERLEFCIRDYCRVLEKYDRIADFGIIFRAWYSVCYWTDYNYRNRDNVIKVVCCDDDDEPFEVLSPRSIQ